MTAVLPLMTALGNPDAVAVPVEWGRVIGVVGRREALLALGILFSLAVLLAIALKALADYAALAFSSIQSAWCSRRLLLAYLNED